MCTRGGRVPVKLEKFTLSSAADAPLGQTHSSNENCILWQTSGKRVFFLLTLETYQLSTEKALKINPRNKIQPRRDWKW